MSRILILADIRPMGYSFHAVVVLGLGKNLLFKSILGRCGSMNFGRNAEVSKFTKWSGLKIKLIKKRMDQNMKQQH